MNNEKINIDTLFHQKLLWIHNYEDKYLNITESYTRSNLELNVLREYKDSIHFLGLYYLNIFKIKDKESVKIRDNFFKKYESFFICSELKQVSNSVLDIFKSYGIQQC